MPSLLLTHFSHTSFLKRLSNHDLAGVDNNNNIIIIIIDALPNLENTVRPGPLSLYSYSQPGVSGSAKRRGNLNEWHSFYLALSLEGCHRIRVFDGDVLCACSVSSAVWLHIGDKRQLVAPSNAVRFWCRDEDVRIVAIHGTSLRSTGAHCTVLEVKI